jgi:hypothetical protein
MSKFYKTKAQKCFNFFLFKKLLEVVNCSNEHDNRVFDKQGLLLISACLAFSKYILVREIKYL